ncbi:hypothetical protein [Agromyces sp. NPDC060279]|uniref:hypothetical protein n=1 Tax=Agromyces sp. NPDC060279 TaxID=3347092 RepID=UPI00365981A1
MAQPDDPAATSSRRARLERLVYGAGASAEERAAAERELAALRHGDAGADAPAGSDGPPDPGAPTEPDGPPAPDAAPADAAADPGAAPAPTPDAPPRRWHRSRTVLVGASAVVFGLLLGGVAGWQLSRAAIAESGLGIPIAGSGAEAMLQRPADFDDRPSLFDAESGIDRDTLRRIGSAESGVAAYGARSTDGRELCLAVIWDRMGGGGTTCTNGGDFPPNGLTMEIGTNDPAVENGLLTLRATWFADGTVQLGIPLL